MIEKWLFSEYLEIAEVMLNYVIDIPTGTNFITTLQKIKT